MKDNFGSGIMMYIVIFFVAIYIVFISLTLNYAQSFRIKNKIIELIEERNGIENADEFKNRLIPYLKTFSVAPDRIDIHVVDLSTSVEYDEKCYYSVFSNIYWQWPFLGLDGTWSVRGETKNVKNCKPISISSSDY